MAEALLSTPAPEISAATPPAVAVPDRANPETAQRQASQMTTRFGTPDQRNSKRLYMNNTSIPAGFNASCGTSRTTTAARSAASSRRAHHRDRSPRENYLTIVAETASRTRCRAMPAEAAANGDYLLPTSSIVQSDEARHISTATHPAVRCPTRAITNCWNGICATRVEQPRVVDAASALHRVRHEDRRKDRESYAEIGVRWIYDDYYAVTCPLEKYGLTIRTTDRGAWNQIGTGLRAEVAQFFATGGWPTLAIDPMTDKDSSGSSTRIPGWYDKYGQVVENYSRLSVPTPHNPIALEGRGLRLPHRCWTACVPCLVREDMVVDKVDGQWRTYCHEACRWTDAEAFRRPTGRQTPNMASSRFPASGGPLPRLETGPTSCSAGFV